MSRPIVPLLSLLVALQASGALATSSDQPDSRASRDWRGRLCVNCQPESDAGASRVGLPLRIATKLVAPNTCADPGTSVWFAEEEDHLSAYLNSAASQYK
jgi:hypothetical protein